MREDKTVEVEAVEERESILRQGEEAHYHTEETEVAQLCGGPLPSEDMSTTLDHELTRAFLPSC